MSGLLQAINRLLQNWPDSFIEFCQANSLASHFLIGDNKNQLPFWYLRVVREHLSKGAHKVSDEEITSIVNYVRNGGDQPATQALRPFISSGVCTRARRAGLIKGKEYLGLCPHCHATKRQFKGGLSSHGTQQFRCRLSPRLSTGLSEWQNQTKALSTFFSTLQTRQLLCIG
jgi:hypothetical protein